MRYGGEKLFGELKSKLLVLEPPLTRCLKVMLFDNFEPCVPKIAGLARVENPMGEHFAWKG